MAAAAAEPHSEMVGFQESGAPGVLAGVVDQPQLGDHALACPGGQLRERAEVCFGQRVQVPAAALADQALHLHQRPLPAVGLLGAAVQEPLDLGAQQRPRSQQRDTAVVPALRIGPPTPFTPQRLVTEAGHDRALQ